MSILTDICDHLNIVLFTGDELVNLLGADVEPPIGLSFLYNGNPCIYYSDRLDAQSRRYTVAHELGHILAGHLNESHSLSSQIQEQEANILAASLISIGLLREMESSNVNRIERQVSA